MNSSKSSQIRVIVLIEAKEENRQKMMDLFLPLVNPPRKREGNIFYSLYSSIENPNELMFDEIWESQEAYDKHYQNSESVELRSKLQNLVSKPIEFKRFKEITG
jgi:quinol monooxygenase YgiN